jgi:hypothetical protein
MSIDSESSQDALRESTPLPEAEAPDAQAPATEDTDLFPLARAIGSLISGSDEIGIEEIAQETGIPIARIESLVQEGCNVDFRELRAILRALDVSWIRFACAFEPRQQIASDEQASATTMRQIIEHQGLSVSVRQSGPRTRFGNRPYVVHVTNSGGYTSPDRTLWYEDMPTPEVALEALFREAAAFECLADACYVLTCVDDPQQQAVILKRFYQTALELRGLVGHSDYRTAVRMVTGRPMHPSADDLEANDDRP